MKYDTLAEHIHYIVGIDEAGRGPLAGPVAVGVSVVSLQQYAEVLTLLDGIRDSKKLSAQKREMWHRKAQGLQREGILTFTVSLIGARHIDTRGISPAIYSGIKRALKRLEVRPDQTHILLDGGLRAPKEFSSQETLIKGDEKEPLIALSSICAKVQRDRYMTRLSYKYPHYGFEQHKGYGTIEHLKSIRKHGVSVVHRERFVHL